MTLEEYVAAAEVKFNALKAERDQLKAQVEDLQKKALTPELEARLQALLA